MNTSTSKVELTVDNVVERWKGLSPLVISNCNTHYIQGVLKDAKESIEFLSKEIERLKAEDEEKQFYLLGLAFGSKGKTK